MNICIDMHDYAGQRSIVMLNENDLFDLYLVFKVKSKVIYMKCKITNLIDYS